MNVFRLGIVALALTTLSACRQEVRFTKVPKPATSSSDVKSRLTTMFVGVPVHLDAVRAQVDQAIPQKLKRVVAWLDDAACFKRKTYMQCESARADTYLSRDGVIKIVPARDRLNLEIPFRYVLKARGLGPARRMRSTLKGSLVAIVGLKVTLGRKLEANAELSEEIKWSSDTISVMRGELDLDAHVTGRVRHLLRDTAQTLEDELQKAPIMASAQRVWKALHNPIKLQSEPDIWLTNLPDRIADGGFVLRNGKPLYRIAIGTRMRIVKGSARPQSRFATRLPRRGRSYKGHQSSTLRVPVVVNYDEIRQALKNAWPVPIVMPGSTITKPMQVSVNDAELFPSKHLVALGLDLDVATPDRAFDLTGKAYLTALPVVNEKTRHLTLRNVKLAKANAIPGIGAGTGKRLRLTAEPFIAGFNNSVKVNVAQTLDDVFTNTNAMLNQDIGNGLWLHGRFDRLNVGRVQPGHDGFILDTDLYGEMSISLGALQAKAATAGVPTKTQ